MPKKRFPAPVEKLLLINFKYPSVDLTELLDLENKLRQIIEQSDLGRVDGNEIALDGDDASYFIYSPNPKKILEMILPILKQVKFMQGGEAIIILSNNETYTIPI
ncbi:MAG: hypothetical protein WCJ58_07765 [bacterium]